MRYLIGILFCILGCGDACATTKTFMPENNLHLQDHMQRPSITESEFDSILDVVESNYKPIISAMGGNFVLQRDWADSTVNAYASRSGSNYIVKMFGGMARRSEMNVAAFGLVACHEVGHHLAGFPLYSDSWWAANEGQSDYFSTFVCARKVFDQLDTPVISESDKSKCDNVFTGDLERSRCYKALWGGLGLGSLLASLQGAPKPSYDTPDQTVVTKTKDAHPKAQCRVDTYLAGALCKDVTWNDAVIPTKDGSVCKNRPKCWFKGSDTDPTDPDDPTDPTDPDPDNGEDIKTEYLLNQQRALYRIPNLEPDETLICASRAHAEDAGTSLKCSHIGSDGSTVSSRAKACGYLYGRTQILACAFASPELAIKAWMGSGSNRAVILSRSYRSFGCSSYGGYYVCLLGTK